MVFSVSVTYITSPNIAIIKYWGKEDEENIIPLNSSISFALSSNVINSKTTVIISEDYKNDELFINEQLVNINENKRMVKLLKLFRSICNDVKNDKNDVVYPSSKLKELHVRIESINNFPTAAGLASSASGLSCLSLCLAKIYQLNYSMIELSKICRLGSGSACRSLYGGFVEWVKDDKDSYAIQLHPNTHWNSIRSVIIILNENSKKISSSLAMKRSKETSELLKYRCEYVVPKRIEELKKALQMKDFEKLCEIMMKDSNEFHSICLDTFPPVHYLSEDSYRIIDIIHLLNEKNNKTIFGYTFDAGPNPVLLCEVNNLNLLMECINYVNKNRNDEKLPNEDYQTALVNYKNVVDIKRVIVSDIGEDPQLIEEKYEF